MRIALAVAALLWAVPSAHASPVSSLARMSSGQMSFEGLDLSDDKPAKGKKTNKKSSKKDKGKKGKAAAKPEPEETPANNATPAPDLGAKPAEAKKPEAPKPAGKLRDLKDPFAN